MTLLLAAVWPKGPLRVKLNTRSVIYTPVRSCWAFNCHLLKTGCQHLCQDDRLADWVLKPHPPSSLPLFRLILNGATIIFSLADSGSVYLPGDKVLLHIWKLIAWLISCARVSVSEQWGDSALSCYDEMVYGASSDLSTWGIKCPECFGKPCVICSFPAFIFNGLWREHLFSITTTIFAAR